MDDKRNGRKRSAASATPRKALQAGIVLEEDIHHTNNAFDAVTATAESYVQEQQARIQQRLPARLFHDADFRPVPSSIDGVHKADQTPKCRCSQPAVLAYSQRSGPNLDRPYYTCRNKRCNFFQWALSSKLMHWYRLGPHTGHVLVHHKRNRKDAAAGLIFSAQDLLQGKVGDCWFLSALAVVAERPDLIARLFDSNTTDTTLQHGIVQVRLFVDGFWKSIVLDNFLPCLIDADEEAQLGQAIQESLGGASFGLASLSQETSNTSESDPRALSEENRKILQDTHEFLENDRFRKQGPVGRTTRYSSIVPRRLERLVTSNDLAYSKAKRQQLWVPLLEKAYAKVHGCYKAISGGHIAEAFLDLTGAPTIVYDLESPSFQGCTFWYQLVSYRKRRLPMGCATSTSQAGIIGSHAYSILDVPEVRNVDVDFFRNELQAGTLGNVSGFTEFDGTVRLLQIRNPHGKGEWKGDYSDTSPVWERLVANRKCDYRGSAPSPELSRSMRNDGVFWIDYDSFLMGFSNVDVVLAFEGNHAKSFATNFPAKKSNHRCVRAFEVRLLEEQPGVPSQDHVELYVMGIQNNRRGSYHGRVDRKKSYKVSDMGILVGECRKKNIDAFELGENDTEDFGFQSVHGQMFGFRRNGHYRLSLDRKQNKRLVVMPISFGHPAATDKELSFALRFVADAPVVIRELPNVPRMDLVLQKLCFGPKNLSNATVGSGTYRNDAMQGTKRILLDDTTGKNKYGEPLFRVYQIDFLSNEGGTVFFYLCVNDEMLRRRDLGAMQVSLEVEATCRGMTCRTGEGLLQHEIIAKGKKFEAAWRRFNCQFHRESKSRLLLTLVQSGQDTEMGTAKCTRIGETCSNTSAKQDRLQQSKLHEYGVQVSPASLARASVDYEHLGVFNGVSFEGSGCNFPVSGDHDSNGFEYDLTNGLDVSQADLDLQRALEKSRFEVTHSQLPVATSTPRDDDLKRAIEASIRDSAPSISLVEETGNGHHGFSDDLEKAIQLSLGESKKSPASEFKGGPAANDVIDLSSPPCSPGRKRKAEIIEIVDIAPERNDTEVYRKTEESIHVE